MEETTERAEFFPLGQARKVLDYLAGIGVGVKINLLLLVVGLLPPLVALLMLQHRNLEEFQNALALYIAVTILLYYPLGRLVQELVVLRQTRRINRYVDEVKTGRRTPEFTLPKEKGDEHDFLRLQRNIFWMVQGLQTRETRLRDTLHQLEKAHEKTAAMNLKLSDAYVKLREVDEMKTNFLSMVSHELRTPLTSVLGFTEITQNDLSNVIFPKVSGTEKRVQRAIQHVRNNLEIIIAEGERLTALVNDVLDIAKMEAGKVVWKNENFHIEEILKRALASTAALFRDGRVRRRLRLEGELPRLNGDRDRLIQVVVNLISNAAKFTEQGEVTCLAELWDSPEGIPGVRVWVTDSGVGIAPEDLDKVFDKFRQVGDTLTGKPSGTGLGLPICRQIVEHHGGRIGVRSTPGQGSEFWFTLPGEELKKRAEHEALNAFMESNGRRHVDSLATRAGLDAGNVPAPGVPRPGVLLVSGRRRVREHLRQRLGGMGMVAHGADNIADALAMAQRAPLELVVVELDDFGQKGVEFATALRKQRRTGGGPGARIELLGRDGTRLCRGAGQAVGTAGETRRAAAGVRDPERAPWRENFDG